MYDIRQFKPTLYLLVFMGLIGYALAAQSPGFFVIPTALVLLNAWLVKTGRFQPFPRWLANMATLLCLLWAFMQATGSRSSMILVIGQFLVFLQLVKLYEQRANRDYAQLLILSLLLMVAAAISTASLVFGILLIIYLFISLYCCLLFHLKVDTELARSAMALPDDPRNDALLRQDQHYLTKSMRRLTGLVSSFAVVTAIFVFLFFPRGMGAGLLGPLQLQPSQSLVGFSEQVSFQRIAAISQNQEVVASVKVWKNGELVRGTEPLLLRGLTLDIYSGDDPEGAQWQWVRSRRLAGYFERFDKFDESRAGQTEYKQLIQLKPTGTPVVFAIAGAYGIHLQKGDIQVRRFIADEVLQAEEPIHGEIEYTVWSRGHLWDTRPFDEAAAYQAAREGFANEEAGNATEGSTRLRRGMWRWGQRGPRRSAIDPAVAAFARKPEVTGNLAAQRDPNQDVSPLDGQIARNIEQYLQKNFKYTLDLTDSKRIGGQDPMAWFLSPDIQRGHCEYFAGAMTLMCQSLGMNARMVIGFKCDEYDPTFANAYVVRQSHAHAWVEVLTDQGWQTFDPTSGRLAGGAAAAGVLQKLKHLFNYLEFAWAKNVVAYDNENRENLIGNLNRELTNSAAKGNNWLQSMKRYLDAGGAWVISSQLLAGLMGLMAIVLVCAIGYFVWEKYRLRRRAARIGLDTLPTAEQLKLARQLGFYDDLMRLLEKHQITRPAHQTPREFAESLAFLPSEVFTTIRRLTAIFYLIRYGRRQLTTPRQKRLSTVIQRLQQFMPAAKMPS